MLSTSRAHGNVERRRTLRVLVGFLIAPWVPGLLLELARLLPAFRQSAGISVIFSSYLTVWLFGVPAFLVFERYSLQKAWHYALGGFLFMQVLTSLAVLPDAMKEPSFSFVRWAGFSATMGALAVGTTITFWLIAIRRSPR